jgi:hypothetical protein
MCILVLFQTDDLKLTLKVKEVRGQLFTETSIYEGAQVKKEIVQVRPFMFG